MTRTLVYIMRWSCERRTINTWKGWIKLLTLTTRPYMSGEKKRSELSSDHYMISTNGKVGELWSSEWVINSRVYNFSLTTAAYIIRSQSFLVFQYIAGGGTLQNVAKHIMMRNRRGLTTKWMITWRSMTWIVPWADQWSQTRNTGRPFCS